MNGEVLGNASRIEVSHEFEQWSALVSWGRRLERFTVMVPCSTEELAHAWVNSVKWLPKDIAIEKFGLKTS